MLQDIDQCISQIWQSVKNIQFSYKDVKIKDHRANKSNAKSQFLTLEQTKQAYNKARREKKKNHGNCNQDRGRGRRAQKSCIPASRANTMNSSAI